MARQTEAHIASNVSPRKREKILQTIAEIKKFHADQIRKLHSQPIFTLGAIGLSADSYDSLSRPN